MVFVKARFIHDKTKLKQVKTKIRIQNFNSSQNINHSFRTHILKHFAITLDCGNSNTINYVGSTQ